MKQTGITTHKSRIFKRMDRTDTNVHHHSLSRCLNMKKIHLPLTICLLLYCWTYTMPIVSCHTVSDTGNDDNIAQQQPETSLIGEHNKNILNGKYNNEIHSSEHNHMRRSPFNNIYPLNEWSSGDVGNDEGQILRRPKDKIRRKLRRKIKQKKEKLHKENDDNFQNTQKGNDFKYVAYDKKYFDYLPIEKIELNSNEAEVDDNIKVVFLLNNNDDNNDDDDENDENDNIENKKQYRKKWKKFTDADSNKRYQHNRSRRSVLLNPMQNNNPIYKRNIDNNGYVENILNVERGSIIPRKNIIRQNREGFVGGEVNGQYYSYGTSNDPWNNRYIRPYNSFQLPVIQNPRIQTSVPLIKYAIPGIYYNPISPPGNYRQPARPSTEGNTPSLNDRFGADDDRVIWDIVYTNTKRPSSPARPVPTTQRPPVESPIGRTPPPLSPRPTLNAEDSRQGSIASIRPQSTSPPFIRNPNQNTIERATTRRPSLPVTTSRPQPSKCVWAIVSCCSRDSLAVRYSCFEANGCHGAFWDLKPCAESIQDAALSELEKFYE